MRKAISGSAFHTNQPGPPSKRRRGEPSSRLGKADTQQAPRSTSTRFEALSASNLPKVQQEGVIIVAEESNKKLFRKLAGQKIDEVQKEANNAIRSGDFETIGKKIEELDDIIIKLDQRHEPALKDKAKAVRDRTKAVRDRMQSIFFS